MTKVSRFVDHYLIYFCLILLTLVVLHQINKLKINDARTEKLVLEVKAAQASVDKTQEKLNCMLKNDIEQRNQIVMLLKLLQEEHKESLKKR